ncbi:hypothetical protein JAAARDRAFT_112881, partial [Jaapia argillacea MUCL 33604]
GEDENSDPPADDGWTNCINAIRRYDENMVQGWKEDIDTLLVFAGLFSGVLTAFNIQSYQMLQQDEMQTSNLLLAQISLQLSNFTISPAFVNSTTPLSLPTIPPFQASPPAVRINILWFLALVCSLSSASIAILVKQWLREYMDWFFNSESPRESVRLRQYRYEGLESWRVFGLMALLPLLLQAALIFFLIGLIELLWTLHHL